MPLKSKTTFEDSTPVKLSFVPDDRKIVVVGKTYKFIYKGNKYYVPISQCELNEKRTIIKIPEWIVNKNNIH
jgi:hypothetical protein